jgi:type III secretion protein C
MTIRNAIGGFLFSLSFSFLMNTLSFAMDDSPSEGYDPFLSEESTSPQEEFSSHPHSDWKPDLDIFTDDILAQGERTLQPNEEFPFPEERTSPELFPIIETPQVRPLPPAPPPAPAPSLPSPAAPTATPPAAPPALETAPQQQPAAPVRPATAAQAPAPGTSPIQINLPGASPEDAKILINFNNVSIVEFIRFISRASNKNFIFDDADLQFNVTIVSEEPTSITNVMTALMQVLRVHGLSLIEQGNNIVIHSNKLVNQVSQVVAEGVPVTPETQSADMVTRVFRLNTLDAEKAAVIIQPLISEGALVEVLKETGHIIVTDLTTNVEKIGQLIRSLDSPTSGFTIGQYVVTNALLDSLISLSERMMAPIAEGKPLVFIAHVPSNSIFVVSTPFLVDRALAILRTLDINEGASKIFSPEELRFRGTSQEIQRRRLRPGERPGEFFPEGGGLTEEERLLLEEERLRAGLAPGVLESTSPWTLDLPTGHIERTKFYIHKLRYRRGDQIVDALGRIGLSLQESGTGNLDLISSIQSVQWLESSNALVFTGTISSIAKVKELIEEIDTPLRQVFLDMLILETTVDDSMNYGVNWGARFRDENTIGSEAFLGIQAPLLGALDAAIPGGAFDPAPLARQAGFTLGIIGRNISHCGVEFSSLGALVRAVHQKTKDNIIMNPKILVEDNTPAEIFVGINTPFQTQAIANDEGNIITTNFEFRDVGTTFRVTPLISNDNIITLDIEEESSSIANIVTAAIAANQNANPGPTTRLSRTITRVHVPDRYFLVMSGMMQDDFVRGRLQVPCLGGIPILGALFSEKNLEGHKRNLMLFIRPQIIDTDQDIDDITRHNQDLYRVKNRTKKMWKYEVEEALDMLNIKEPDVSLHDTEQFNP